MNILIVKAGEHPYTKMIGNDLHDLQQVVGGYIQAIFPFDDPVALVCEEEALYHPEQKWNRPVSRYGVIKGTFFLCGIGEEDFTDLPEELIEKYTQHFWQIYDFVQIGKHLMPIPLNEEED